MKIIEILIAIILVYALLSILVSILVEWWSSFRKARGNMLRQAIFQMLNDPLNINYGYFLINHPLVNSMTNKAENRPFQYLDSGIFADALIDIIADQCDKGVPIDQSDNPSRKLSESNSLDAIALFEQGLLQMNSSPFQKMLMSLLSKSGGKYTKVKKSIEEWYDTNMERTSGWYKRKQKNSFLVFGFIVALLLNIDSIHLLKVVSLDENLRKNLVVVAEDVAEKYDALEPESKNDIDAQLKTISTSLQRIDSSTVDSTTRKIIESGKGTMTRLAKQLRISDSTSESHLTKANDILDVTAQLGLPIGYSSETAPFSWFKGSNPTNDTIDIRRSPNDTIDTRESSNDTIDTRKPTNLIIAKKSKLVLYNYNRNNLGEGNRCFIFLWLAGIVITGLMLSFGAPFWFDLLIKLVNVRKAGVKPEPKNKIK